MVKIDNSAATLDVDVDQFLSPVAKETYTSLAKNNTGRPFK